MQREVRDRRFAQGGKKEAESRSQEEKVDKNGESAANQTTFLTSCNSALPCHSASSPTLSMLFVPPNHCGSLSPSILMRIVYRSVGRVDQTMLVRSVENRIPAVGCTQKDQSLHNDGGGDGPPRCQCKGTTEAHASVGTAQQ